VGKESEMRDILVATTDGIGVVTLNRVETFNAVKLSMWRELADIFSNLAHDDAIRAIVLTGAGANFCVGADVTEFKAIRENREQSTAYEVSVDACSAAIANVPKPVIAAISGYCLGGGCHLALACDFRLRIPRPCLEFLPPSFRLFTA
jgi:enoyl-CoA hydratase/carnithine racemase